MELVAQIKARLQANLSSSGHLVAAMRSMSSFALRTLSGRAKGSCFYRSICRIEKELSESPKSVSDKLAAIAKSCLQETECLSALPEITRHTAMQSLRWKKL